MIDRPLHIPPSKFFFYLLDVFAQDYFAFSSVALSSFMKLSFDGQSFLPQKAGQRAGAGKGSS
jgi:hypothetical protein